MEHYGIWSLVPPVVAIVLAFTTKQVIASLFAAIWAGATIMAGGNIITGFGDTVIKYIVGSIADSWHAGIIVFSLALGGMIGIVAKSGGAMAIANWLGSKAKTARSGQVVTWAMGLVIFFDDYSNTLLVGNTMRPLTDKLRISREKLSYICDSTAAPVASMAFVSTWIAYEVGLLKDAFGAANVEINAYEAFLLSIPYRFYSLVTLFFVFGIGILVRDYGPMLTAERRARKTGKVVADGATPLASKELTDMRIREGIPLRAYNALIPVIMVVILVIAGLYANGKGTVLAGDDSQLVAQIQANPYAMSSLREIIGNADASVVMTWAAFGGSLIAIVLVLAQRILTFREAIDAWVDGSKSLMMAAIVLVLAWGIGSLCENLGTSTFLVGVLSGKVTAGIVPVTVFLLGCVIAFSTGTSWGTTAILMPIAVPLVYQLSPEDPGRLIYATIGAVFTGAVFGDHCSPISDTTIMSSMASASDHIDHVKTQMPYAITCAVISIIFGYIPAAFNMHPLISLVLAIATAFAVIRFVGTKVDEMAV